MGVDLAALNPLRGKSFGFVGLGVLPDEFSFVRTVNGFATHSLFSGDNKAAVDGLAAIDVGRLFVASVG